MDAVLGKGKNLLSMYLRMHPVIEPDDYEAYIVYRLVCLMAGAVHGIFMLMFFAMGVVSLAIL